MNILDKEIEKYAEAYTAEESQILKAIQRDTHVNVLMPRMLSGHMQGRILSMFSHMIKPGFILEIGTFTGYSAICLAEGLQKDGQLITIDINKELEGKTRSFFENSPYSKNIDYQIGDALDIIPHLTMNFDLVFIDADKENYCQYFELVFDKVSAGGFIIADNVLWSGKVLPNSRFKSDKDTIALKDFNHKVHNDPRVENVLLPVRDGLMILKKN